MLILACRESQVITLAKTEIIYPKKCVGIRCKINTQLKKLKSCEPFWSYQLNSTANPAHLPPNWPNRQCCLADSSKTAPMILIFSIPMGADYSFYLKSIATCVLTFFGYIISVLASVQYVCITHLLFSVYTTEYSTLLVKQYLLSVKFSIILSGKIDVHFSSNFIWHRIIHKDLDKFLTQNPIQK